MYELWYINNTKVNIHLLNMIIKKKTTSTTCM